MDAPVQQAGRAARQAQGSSTVEWLARTGLASRGVVWLVIGLLAASAAFAGTQERTDQTGALKAIADKPFGTLLLLLLVVGFLGYVAWQALEAAVGHRDEPDDKKRTLERVLSGVKVVVYASLALLTLRFLLGGSGGGDKTSSMTADVMSRSGGRWLVGLVGVLVVAAGFVMAGRGLKSEHLDKLDSSRTSPRVRRVAGPLGKVGLVGRGLVLALIGGFLVRAAAQFDPKQAKGLDAALQSLAEQPFGKLLLAVTALSLVAFAAWSFIEAACRKV